MRSCWITQGAHPGALWQPGRVGWSEGWEGGSRGSGQRYTYGWFMLFYGRNQHNIVKQLSSSLKKKRLWERHANIQLAFSCYDQLYLPKLCHLWTIQTKKKKKKTKTPLPINFWSCTNVKKKNKEATNVGKNVNKRKRSSCKKKFLELWRV